MSFLDDEGDPVGQPPFNAYETDWVLEMIEAKNGTYVGVGYSRSPVTASGRILPTWVWIAPNGEPIYQADVDFGDAFSTNGRFDAVVERDNAFYMIGYKGNKIALAKVHQEDYASNFEQLISIPEVDNFGGAVSGRGIAISQSGEVIIVGFYNPPSSLPNESQQGMVMKTDLNGNVIDYTLIDLENDTQDDTFLECRIINDNGGSDYDIIFTGTSQVADNSFVTEFQSHTDVVGNDLDAGLDVVIRNDDIVYGKMSADFQVFDYTSYDSQEIFDFSPRAFTSEYGPFTPDSNSPGVVCSEPNCVADLFIDNSNDKGYDIDLLPDGSIGITALLNTIVMTTGLNYFLQDVGNTDYVVKALASDSHGYHDYIDGDAYFLRIDQATGELLPGTQHVGRVSGADSHVDFDVEQDGDIIIGLTTADHMFTDDLLDVAANDGDPIEHNFLVKLDANYNLKWRRHFAGQGEGNCLFDVKATRDGGYLIGGNNEDHFPSPGGPEVEKFNFVKLGPDCQSDPAVFAGANDIALEEYIVTGTENWTVDRRIKGTVRIPNGAQLIIDGTGSGQNGITIQFAYEKYNEDYGGLVDDQNTGGIIVEEGGYLYVKNATIKGLNACGHEQMWEGIHVMSDPNVSQSAASGRVEFVEGAVVKNAVIGVLAGDADYVTNATIVGGDAIIGNTINVNSGIGQWQLRGAFFTIQQNAGGGIIESENATFIDNREGVVFAPYLFPNSSTFVDTDFLCEGSLVDQSITPIWMLGLKGTANFVMLYDVQSIDFQDCKFMGNVAFEPNARGTGISAINSRFNVVSTVADPSVYNFKYLWQGIDARSWTGGLLSSPYIARNTFHNVKQGVILRQTSLAVVEENFFLNIPQVIGPSWGVSASGTHDVYIVNNNFTGFASGGKVYGTLVRHTGDEGGVHLNNNYQNLVYGTQFEGMNQAFTARCSEYDGMLAHAWVVGPTYTSPSVLMNQGINNSIGTQKADNSFIDPCGGSAASAFHIYSNIDFNYYDKAGNPYPADVTDDPPSPNCIGSIDVFSYRADDLTPIDCGDFGPPCPEPPCFNIPETEYENSDGGVKYRNNLLRAYVHWDVHETPDENSLIEITTALDFLAERQQPEDIKMLTATHIDLGQYQEASYWLSQMVGADANSQKLYNYYQQLISEGIAGRDIYHLDGEVVGQMISDLGSSTDGMELFAHSFDLVYNDTYHEIVPEEITYFDRSDSRNDLKTEQQNSYVYPNPFTESITFYVVEALEEEVSIKVSNLNGQLMWSHTLEKGNPQVIWSPERLAAGTYFYHIELADGSILRDKIVYLK